MYESSFSALICLNCSGLRKLRLPPPPPPPHFPQITIGLENEGRRAFADRATEHVINSAALGEFLIGAKKGQFSVNLFLLNHSFIRFCIIMSFRKPCHMPFRKLILPFTLTEPENIKVENNGAVNYVGGSLTVHNPLFFVTNCD